MLFASLPPRGAWIEIRKVGKQNEEAFCRSPRGERGLKSVLIRLLCIGTSRRSPRGERGLKC